MKTALEYRQTWGKWTFSEIHDAELGSGSNAAKLLLITNLGVTRHLPRGAAQTRTFSAITEVVMTHGPTKQSTGNYKGSKKDKHENRDKGDNQKKKQDPSWAQLPKKK